MNRLPHLHRLAVRLLLIACLLPATALAGSKPAAEGNGEAAAKPEFTLVTLNLYHDRDDWPRRRVQIVDELRRLRPDAIALQEVLQHEKLQNQAAWLANELGYDWHFVTTDPPSQARRYGNALLTRHPVTERGETLLHPLEDHRTAGRVQVQFEGRPLNLYFTHLYWAPDGGPTRAEQLADLLAYVEATSGDAPALIAGDFNAEADAPELGALHEAWLDAWGTLHPDADPATATTLNPAYFDRYQQVDHVFLQRGRMQPLEARLLFAEPDAQGTWASDHRGMLVRLRLPDPPATDPGPASGHGAGHAPGR